jgi:hypothetical protein
VLRSTKFLMNDSLRCDKNRCQILGTPWANISRADSILSIRNRSNGSGSPVCTVQKAAVASKGIGKSIALRFAEEGANVAICARREPAFKAT